MLLAVLPLAARQEFFLRFLLSHEAAARLSRRSAFYGVLGFQSRRIADHAEGARTYVCTYSSPKLNDNDLEGIDLAA